MRCVNCGVDIKDGTCCTDCMNKIQMEIGVSYQQQKYRGEWKVYIEQEQKDWNDYVERWRRWRGFEEET